MASFELEQAAGAMAGRCIIGVDEVGRGPWAGPVVAAAAWLDIAALPAPIADRLNDSKTLSAVARQQILHAVTPYAEIALGRAEVAEIDAVNILQASLRAMSRAVTALSVMLAEQGKIPDLALVDGNRLPADLPCPGQAVVKGDAHSRSIAAASIAAKCARDAEMALLDQRYPGYGWARNVGYGTTQHRAAISEIGITVHHRRSFRPILAFLQSADNTTE
jgi:ribonuclease HII